MVTSELIRIKLKMFSQFWISSPLTEIVIINEDLNEIIIQS